MVTSSQANKRHQRGLVSWEPALSILVWVNQGIRPGKWWAEYMNIEMGRIYPSVRCMTFVTVKPHKNRGCHSNKGAPQGKR